ncbi:hypothetical protein PUNSTDRAFT_109272 [Punctularia strigosozonata HHB-11173 SS5]|uniref:RlpA-like protein double-psi beta-barrel domain-containing protein n=1 Tax=Punctularia strigosozonata (strain HHB-11173) TaxID=741275 RepID=R7S330_PUNST|nr:uncharacterized protein PUNSTDRAFT_109272 [Punctularia strigosozonata HHB-11173 SS5]EIN03661.1 hypothetical protein PUNSTDRAFT_109272 [Punctularia strigosozonata HHB-11173 SS5]
MRTFTAGLLVVALLGAFASAENAHEARGHRRSRSLSQQSARLTKRFINARFTFYETGLGACGKTNTDADFIVALNSQQYGSGGNCFDMITITANGKTTQAQITDECPGCPYGGLDLSPGLFSFFADQSAGVIYGSWNFGSGSDPAPSSTSTTHSPKPTPTTTSEPPPPSTTSTSEPPPPTTTSSKTHKTSSSSTFTPETTTTSSSEAIASTTSLVESMPSSSAEPSPTSSAIEALPTGTDVGQLELFNEAMMALGGFLVSAAGAQQ